MGFEYIYACQYTTNEEFIDIRNKLANAGFRLTLVLDIPDGLSRYAVVFKYKDEYYIANYDYSYIRNYNVEFIFNKIAFINKSIKLINEIKENNMKTDNIETATITLKRYNSLQEKAKVTDDQIEKLATNKIEDFKKDLENKLGITIQKLDDGYFKTNKTIKERFDCLRENNAKLRTELNTAKEELNNSCNNYKELYKQYNELRVEYATLKTQHDTLKTQHEMLEKKYQERKKTIFIKFKNLWKNIFL